MSDVVNHPKHYTSHPSGVEAITITRHYGFQIGNAIKYLWRAGLKSDPDREAIDKEIEDLEKAKWYLQDRIDTLKGQSWPPAESCTTPKPTSTYSREGHPSDCTHGHATVRGT